MKQAKIVITHVDYQTNRISIRNGKNGKGKEIWSCKYWFASEKSVEAMDKLLAAKLTSLIEDGYTIFGTNEDY